MCVSSGAAVPALIGRHGAVCGVRGERTGQWGLWKRPAVCQQAAEGPAGSGGGDGRTQRQDPGTQRPLPVSLPVSRPVSLPVSLQEAVLEYLTWFLNQLIFHHVFKLNRVWWKQRRASTLRGTSWPRRSRSEWLTPSTGLMWRGGIQFCFPVEQISIQGTFKNWS